MSGKGKEVMPSTGGVGAVSINLTHIEAYGSHFFANDPQSMLR